MPSCNMTSCGECIYAIQSTLLLSDYSVTSMVLMIDTLCLPVLAGLLTAGFLIHLNTLLSICSNLLGGCFTFLSVYFSALLICVMLK